MRKKSKAHGFMGVDSHEDPDSWIRVLDRLRQEPFYIAYKKRVAELVRPKPGGLYLDVGAGTGDDARTMAEAAQATAVAVDLSRAMMIEASRRGLSYPVVSDAALLPFDGNTFDGCWADRTFQHLIDPKKVLSEMVRVTKHDGRVVTVDPDYGTQAMEFPDRKLARRVLRFRADFGLQNGTLAHSMAGMFSASGLSHVMAEAMTLVVRDPTAVDNVMGLRTWARSAQSVGYLSKEDSDRWENLFDDTVAAGRFMYSVTFILTAGTKPAST